MLGRPTTGVGTLDVLSCIPLRSFLQLFRHLFLPPADLVVVSQNPVTPGRVHPETDDKVHPATLACPLSARPHIHASAAPYTHPDIYIRKLTKGSVDDPWKKKETGSVKTRDASIDSAGPTNLARVSRFIM